MSEQTTDTIEDMRSVIESGAERLLSISEAESETRRAAGKWSSKEIIGHLIDSAANNHSRFVAAQFKDDLIFPGYDQEAWVTSQNYQRSSLPALITLWKSYNLHLLHIVSSIPEDKLKQLCPSHSLHRIAWKAVDEAEPATLEYLISDYIEHMKHHLRQIPGA